MLSLQALRQDPDSAKSALAKRGEAGHSAAVDRDPLPGRGERRRAIAEVEELKARRNEVSKEIGALKRQGADADELILEMRAVGERDRRARCRRVRSRATDPGAPPGAAQPSPSPRFRPGERRTIVVVREWGERTCLLLRAQAPLGSRGGPGNSGPSPGRQGLRLRVSPPQRKGGPASTGAHRLHAGPPHRASTATRS